jgi:acetyl esterase
MIGDVYLLKGEPEQVLARADWIKGTPRNVEVLRADGTHMIRPFRGLRKLPAAPHPVPQETPKT